MVEQFGPYQIIRKLAAGGMAEVFLAKQTSLGGFERLVCIKRILEHLGEQKDFITMFEDEARIAANLTHPNIAQIYDIGEVDGSYFIAMEYVRGQDLRRIYNAEVARGRALPQAPAAHIAMYAAAGLDYAHRQTSIDGRPLGIVHRDISPQNILVTYDGHVKIVDFGVAKAANKANETKSGVLKGKYSYMSPEQASGDPIDARTDIFALGITMYEVTTGTRLFKRENELETLHAVIQCEVKPPSEVIPGYDPKLEAVLLRALSADPEDRFPTAGEMAKALEACLLARQHPTSPAALGDYMQGLFAEHLADELLLGAGVEEASQVPPKKRRKVESSVTRPVPELAVTEVSNRGGVRETTQVDEGWGSGAEEPEAWAAIESRSRDTWRTSPKGHESVSTAVAVGFTDTTDVTAGARLGDERHERTDRAHRESELRVQGDGWLGVVLGTSPNPRPRWLAAVAIAVILMGIGAGVALILTAQRDGGDGPVSGPLTVDSEPRGARVEFLGLGSPRLNQVYGGHRTPFTILEGVRIDVPLTIRFVKDGFDIVETGLPPLEANAPPAPLFVTLPPKPAGTEEGSLILLSTPKGARVLIDGEEVEGITPLSDVRVSGGAIHKIEFRKDGFRPRSENRFIEPGSRVFVEVNLFPNDPTAPAPSDPQAPAPAARTPQAEPKPAAVSAVSPAPETPEAAPAPAAVVAPSSPPPPGILVVSAPLTLRVTVGSRFVGETPVKALTLPAGKHRLTLHSPEEGLKIERTVRLTAGRRKVVDIELGRGKLALNATPWAVVRVGSKAPLETPTRLDLYEGAYVVRFECPDGRTRKASAQVQSGQTANLSVNCRE